MEVSHKEIIRKSSRVLGKYYIEQAKKHRLYWLLSSLLISIQ
jgi:hypothetical protein